MSAKKSSGEMKNKTINTRKNTRRSLRNASISNGDADMTKERNGQRIELESKVEEDAIYDQNVDGDFYKDLIDLLPLSELNCSPVECPAPPGTRVNLHGVILHETLGGLVVLNVRWRNKVYSGALIDVEKNKWATEKIPCDPPCAQDGKQIPPPPPIKKIKITTSNMQVADDSDSGSSKKRNIPSPTTPSKNSKFARGNNKKRPNQDQLPSSLNGDDSPLKKNKAKLCFVNGSESLFECPDPNCRKRYKNKNGLSYHQKTAHSLKNESCDDSTKENKSDSDSGDDQFVIDERSCSEIKKEDDEQNRLNTPADFEIKQDDTKEFKNDIEKLKIEEAEKSSLLSIKQEEVVDYQALFESRDEHMNGLRIKEDQFNNENASFAGVLNEPESKTFCDDQVNRRFSSGPTHNLLQLNKTNKEGKTSPYLSQHSTVHASQFSNFNKMFTHNEHFSQFSPTITNIVSKPVFENDVDASDKINVLESMRYTAPTKLPVVNQIHNETTFSPSLERDVSFVMTASNLDVVGTSDNEQTPPPESILINCHKIYHLDERNVPLHTPNLCFSGEMYKNNLFQEDKKVFEKSLLFKELAENSSSSTNTVSNTQTSPQQHSAFKITDVSQLPNKDMQDFSFESKNIPPNLLNLLKQDCDSKFDCSSSDVIDNKKNFSEQNLVIQSSGKKEVSFGDFTSNVVTTAAGALPHVERNVDFPEKQTLTNTSFSVHDIRKQRVCDEEVGYTWSTGLLESPKDHQYFEMIKHPPLSSSFHMQVPAANNLSDDKKRSINPVPIAPIPIAIQHLQDSIGSSLEADQPHMSRFTLTNDRLVHNPIENRGRPRKFCSEVGKQPSLVDPVEQGKGMFGFSEATSLRKQSSAMRTSVIQGANLSMEESIKLSERSNDGRHAMPRPQSRSTQLYDRFPLHSLDGKTTDMRVDRYKDLSPPPRMFLPANGSKNIITPPHSRAPSHSPRDSIGHSSNFNADILSKTQYEHATRERFEKMSSPNFYERQRSKQTLVRNISEHSRIANDQRLGDVLRNNTFMNTSPHDTIQAMQSYSRNHDMDKDQQRITDYRYRYQTSPGIRIDGISSRNENRTVFDHRVPKMEDGEQARLRERFLHQNTMQTGLNSISPSAAHSTVPTNRSSTNLVLTRVDGAFLGPLSYENRTEHKR
ncbi:uncharacterized protein LOC101238046 isoform X1 [Hydra vulgaris]|uniref:uncharacterized protein LOC101238046 isoform X1 n=1 Tax=Hydra vulgaris TaxID=6087 RepID=UPI001F5F09AC|nr:uncharacterized protein LOC101238046 [Hydra vulgaris]XP_047140519.1 uncharacterized protein LOC101238046 [Hydra vulgaris]XP_047140520.1 uncharacterized protein LOC101238046 [Hydra vulgaris]